MKNCDLGLENAAFSRPRSQFFTIRTSQAVNNIYTILICDGRTQKIRMQDRWMAGFVVSLDSFTDCPLLKQKKELGKNAPK